MYRVFSWENWFMKWNNFSQTHDFFFIEGQIEPVFNCPCLGRQVVTAPLEKAGKETVTQSSNLFLSLSYLLAPERKKPTNALCYRLFTTPASSAHLTAMWKGKSQNYFDTLLTHAEDMKKKGVLSEKPLVTLLLQIQNLWKPRGDLLLQ